MKKTKTPAPRRAGNAKRVQAEKHARRVVALLDGDPNAIRTFIEIASTLLKRKRNLRRRA